MFFLSSFSCQWDWDWKYQNKQWLRHSKCVTFSILSVGMEWLSCSSHGSCDEKNTLQYLLHLSSSFTYIIHFGQQSRPVGDSEKYIITLVPSQDLITMRKPPDLSWHQWNDQIKPLSKPLKNNGLTEETIKEKFFPLLHSLSLLLL